MWAETPERLEVSLTIPGLRGQPPACLAMDVTTTTATITAFGRAVWSCVLRGHCVPDTAEVIVADGEGMLPVISVAVQKAARGERWGGFILKIGEDSIL